MHRYAYIQLRAAQAAARYPVTPPKSSPVQSRPSITSAAPSDRIRQLQLAYRTRRQSLVNAQHPNTVVSLPQASSGLPSGSLVRSQHPLAPSSPRNATPSDSRARLFPVVSSPSTRPVVDLPDCSVSVSAFPTDDKTPKKLDNPKIQKKSASVVSVSVSFPSSVSGTAIPDHRVSSSSGASPGSSSGSSSYVTAASHLSGSSSGLSSGSGSSSYVLAVQHLPASSSSGSSSGSGSGSASSGTAVQHLPASSSSGSASGSFVSHRHRFPVRQWHPLGIKEAYAQIVAEEEREEQLKLQRAAPSPKVDPLPLASPSPAKPSPQVIPVQRSSPSPLRPFSKAGPVSFKEEWARLIAEEEAEAAAAKAKIPVSPQPVTPQRVKRRRSVKPTHVSPSLVSPSLVRPGPVSPSHFSPTPVRLAPYHFLPTPVRPASTSPSALVSPTPVRPARITPAAVSPAPVLPARIPPWHFLPTIRPTPASPGPVSSPVRPASISPAPVSPTPVSTALISPYQRPVRPDPISPASISPAPVSPPHISPPPVCPAPISTPPLDWRPPKRQLKVFPATAAEALRRFREAKAARLRAGNKELNLSSILEEVVPSAQPQQAAASPHRPQDPVRPPIQPPVQPSVPTPVHSPVRPPVQPPKTPVSQTFAPDSVRTMHTRWSSPDTVELYPGNAPSPRHSQLELWRQLSKFPLDDQIAGRVLTPPPAPKEPTPVSSPLQPSDVDLSDDLMGGGIPMYQLAAMMAKARDGTPEPPSRPDTPSCLHGGMTDYEITPPRYWWKNEPTPPRNHPRLYLEDDPSEFTYDFSRTVTPPEVHFQDNCSLGFIQARDKERKRQVDIIREALDKKFRPADPPAPPPRSPSPPPTKVTFVDEDGNTLDCQDGPAPPRPAPSSCRKVPRTLPQAPPGSHIPALPSLRLVHSVASSPPPSQPPSSSSWSKLGLAAAAGIAGIALGFAARWMMS